MKSSFSLCLAVLLLLIFVYACVDQGWTYFPGERRI
jgi:hypothetical protein